MFTLGTVIGSTQVQKLVVGRGGLEPPTSALTRLERRSVEYAIANDVTGRYQLS